MGERLADHGGGCLPGEYRQDCKREAGAATGVELSPLRGLGAMRGLGLLPGGERLITFTQALELLLLWSTVALVRESTHGVRALAQGLAQRVPPADRRIGCSSLVGLFVGLRHESLGFVVPRNVLTDGNGELRSPGRPAP